MRRGMRMLTDVLALLVGLGPGDRTRAVLLAIAGVITLDWFSTAFLQLFDGPDQWDLQFWVSLLALPVVLLVFFVLTRQVWRRLDRRIETAVTSSPHPAATPGLILFLSTYSTFAGKLPEYLRGSAWKQPELAAALAQDRPDWPVILDHVQASNMQPALEAIRYHREAGVLRHVWLLSTSDMVGEDGKVTREGSHTLVPAFKRILGEGLGWTGIQLHDCEEHPSLLVPAYQVQELFEKVDEIYRTDAVNAGLQARQVTADITGGTVTMSAGMLLAGVLFDRPLEYTAADRDPAHGLPLERPTPYAIEVDELALRRLIFRHLALEESPDRTA